MVTHAQIEPYLDDYAAATGHTTDKYICPLTLQPCALEETLNGHIINQAIKYANNATVPVSRKIDNFYGSRVEKPFIDFSNITELTPVQTILLQPKLTVKFQADGPNGPEYKAFVIRENEVAEKDKHLPVYELSQDGASFHIGIRDVSKGDPRLPTQSDMGQVVVSFVGRYFPTHWAATMLKVAHLTLFKMAGYRAIYNPSGDVLRRVLVRYFDDNASADKAPSYFRDFENSVHVFRGKSEFDTLRDNQVISHSQNGVTFGITLAYEFTNKTMLVTIPQTVDSTDIAVATRLYDSLMKNPQMPQDNLLMQFDGKQWHPLKPMRLHYDYEDLSAKNTK